ncbi:MAG: ArsA family ATPase [Velocimicrobium sp.]
MRIILYTGKGGVGKTSIAAATACRIAADGKKVLIMSTDQAHSLGDSYGIMLGEEPVIVTKNLYALEINSVYESEKSWGHLKEYMKEMLTINGDGGIEVEELLVFPGMEELFSMFKIQSIYESGEYDVLIVDCAPTGETLSLLKYPEKLSGFMEKILPIKRKGIKVAGPAVEKLLKIPMPEESVFDDIEYIMDRMGRLQRLLTNKDIVSLRIVTTPEKIVISESKRNFTCLHLYNYNVDAIIINRIYPKKAMEGYFSKWMVMQEEGILEIEESFFEIPRFYLELQKNELCSLPVLEKVSKTIFGDVDPVDVLFKEEIFRVERDNMGTKMKILLPFANKEELNLNQNGTELILSVKNEQRRFQLPVELGNMQISGAKFEDGYLILSF